MRVTEYAGLSGAAVSSDGRYLVHTDWTTGDLTVRDLRTDESRRITNNGPLSRSVEFAEFFMRFSPDGRRLAYIWDRNGYELYVTDVEGSAAPRFIYRNPPGQGEVLAYDWSDDGAYVAAVVPAISNGGLTIALIAVADGAVTSLRELDRATAALMPHARMSFSPDSRFLAYELPVAGSKRWQIFVRDLRAGVDGIAGESAADDRLFDWTPDGTALLFRSDRAGGPAAWLQPMDGGAPRGPAVRVADLEEGAQPLGFARNGTYYFAVPEARRHEVFVASLDLQRDTLNELSRAAPESPGPRSAPDWSPDGKLLAYLDGGAIVIESADAGEERRLDMSALGRIFTVATGEQYLRWSPDGRSLLVPQYRTLFRVDVARGEATPFITDRRSRYGRWSPDGATVYYTRQPGANDRIAEIVRMDLETEKKEVLHRAPLPGDHYSSLELAPDGRWLAFSGVAAVPAPEFEATTLMMIPATGGPARSLLQISGREWIKIVGWSPDGREILFTRGGKLREEGSTLLWSIPAEGGEPRAIETGVPVLHSIRFHPDGRRIAFDSGRRGFEIRALEGLCRRATLRDPSCRGDNLTARSRPAAPR